MSLTLQEQETHLNMTGDNRDLWEIFSDDPVLQRKLENIGAKLVRNASNGIGKFYELPASQVSFRKPVKPMSDEKKARLVAQLQKARERP